MSNIEEDRIEKFIKAYEEAKSQSFVIESINKDFFFEFSDCLIERIKELEEINKKYIVQLTDEQYRKLVDNIRKEIKQEFEQKVKDIIEKRKNNCTVINSFIIEVLEELLEDK